MQRDGERDEIDDGGRVQQREREKDQVHRSADLTVYYARRPEHAADGDVREHDCRNDPRRGEKWFKEAARRRAQQHRERGVDQVRGRRARTRGRGGSESLRYSDPEDQDRDRSDRNGDRVPGRDADEECGAHYAGAGSSCSAVENAQFLANTLTTVVASNNCSFVIPSWRRASAR